MKILSNMILGLSLLGLVASCYQYSSLEEAHNDPEEKSYAYGTLNGQPWEAQANLVAAVGENDAGYWLEFSGIQSFDNPLHYDQLTITAIPELGRNQSIPSEERRDFNASYAILEYGDLLTYYEVDYYKEHTVTLNRTFFPRVYTGSLEITFVKSAVFENAPDSPYTLHLVVEEFRASFIDIETPW